MHLASFVGGLLCATAWAAVAPAEVQAPLQVDDGEYQHGAADANDLIRQLHLAEIIPSVIDDFIPNVNAQVKWADAEAKIGNTIKPALLSSEPKVLLSPVKSSTSHSGGVAYEQYVVALSDPDAKSRDDPKWAEMCHWLAYWPHSASEHSMTAAKEDIVPYKAPAPPPKTWKHRYVLVVLAPINGTKHRLHLETPAGRQRWGNDEVRTGVRQWAEKHGLGVVGVNFVYSMNKKQ